MLQRVAEFITRYSMFRPGGLVGVAVSGGADSVCLLHALAELRPRWNLRLHVLHLNHNLRGEESRADAAFVERLAAELGLPATVREAQPALWEGNLEQAAREARLAFFREAMAAGTVDSVALGHTRSDQAETVLFRLLRGAGSAGLAGIRPVTAEGIVRPLLAVERADVEAFLRSRALSWREDSTNAGREFARNRIRHDLLPLLEREWNPGIRDTLANTAEWARAEEEYWAGETARLAETHLTEAESAVLVSADALGCLPLAAARRLVRLAVGRVKGDLRGIEFQHIEAAIELARASDGHGRFQAPGLDVYRSFDWLRIGKPGTDTLENRNYRFAAPAPGRVELPGGAAVLLELIDIKETFGLSECVYNGVMGGLDWERLSGPLELRNWRPGDQYQPMGMSGAEKIKTLFQTGRVPLWERRHWPVLTQGEAIVWARRFGPAAQYAAGPGTRTVLAVRESDPEGR
jgi:tRNA(Ile)-lysidine synthase